MNATDATQKTIPDALSVAPDQDADPRTLPDRVADDTTLIPSANMDFVVACAAADCVRVTLNRLAEGGSE